MQIGRPMFWRSWRALAARCAAVLAAAAWLQCGLVCGLVLPAWAVAAEATAAPTYYFRQAPQAGLVGPAGQGLSSAERQFIGQLPVVRVGLNLPDNRPYEVIAANGEIAGIQIEILTHLAQALGVRLEPVVLDSFPAALDALRQRRIDIMASVGYQAEREAYMAYTLGTAPNPGAIIGRAADNRFATEPTLNGRRVAVERSYVTQFYVRRLYPEVLVNDQPDTAAALRSVALGEDDYYFGSLLMAMDRLQRDQISGLAVKKSLVYGTGLMHFGVRSDWPLLASALSKGVAALRQTPLPALQNALGSLQGQPVALPGSLPVNPQEQAQLASRPVLRAGAVRGLALLNEATANGGHSGIAADYLSQVATQLGLAVDVRPFDSEAEMLDALREGRIQLVPVLTRTPQRAQDFAFSDPYLEMPYHVIARSDAPMYWDLASLRGKRLALTAQHPVREFMASRYPDIQIVDAPPGPGAMDMVAAGQADAAVEAKLYANLRIATDNNGLLRQVARVDEIPAQFHFAASREASALVPLINRSLADIPEQERERLYRRWVAVEIRPGFAWQRHLPWLATAALALLALAGLSAWWMRCLLREARARGLAEQRLRTVASSLPGVVFRRVVGPDGRLVEHYLSESAETFLGPGALAEPDLARLVARHLDPADARVLAQAQADSLASGLPFKQSFCYQHPLTGPRWLHCESRAQALADGRVAWTGYLVDVSTERELQARLLDAMQAKNLFVATAGHELRAPLQVILLALHRLGAGPLDAAQRHSWQLAQQSIDALVQLIDDVLDLARFEAGRVRLQPAPVALLPMLRQIGAQHRLAADARGLDFALVLQPGLPDTAVLDALRLRQLLGNLLGNAIKYTASGGVTLTVGPLAPALAGDGQGWLQLSVRDTGVGISAEQQRHLFEPFGALPGSAPPGLGGVVGNSVGNGNGNAAGAGAGAGAGNPAGPARSTGLGLAVCKRLVQAMQGEILVISQPGQGTEVRVHLPLPNAAPATPPLVTERSGAVLVVDDDALSRLLMAEMLRRAGLEVIEAEDGEQALGKARGSALAAVISDRHMPGIDGPTLLRLIGQQAIDDGLRCPARLLCSGDVDPESGPWDGIDAVLSKPVSAAALIGLLATLGVRAGPVDRPAG